MAVPLSQEEQETIILYNQKDKTCFIGTHDRSLITKLDNLALTDELINRLTHEDGYAEYQVPKRYIKVRPPRKLTEEQRQKAGERMKAMREAKKEEN